MKKIYLVPAAMFTVILFINGCSKSSSTSGGGGGTTPCTLSVSFTANIKKILDVNCNICHAPGSGNAMALAKWSYDGTYLSAFNNRTSITGQVSAGIMPQSGPLPQIVRDSIACWVNKGAPN